MLLSSTYEKSNRSYTRVKKIKQQDYIMSDILNNNLKLIRFSIITFLFLVQIFWGIEFSFAKNKPQSGDFDYYVFAQSWYPSFCCSGPKGECENLSPFMQKNLSPHGLWPNKNNIYSAAKQPSYCEHSKGCESIESCSLDSRKVNEERFHEIKMMMPLNLIKHEWKKHGTCSNYSQAKYFKNILYLQNKYKTPEVIQNKIGENFKYTELLKIFGGENKVNLFCRTIDKNQYLDQVHYFLNKDLEEISNEYSKTNCNRNLKIYIKNNPNCR